MPRPLCIRPVYRYRRARYPSLHPWTRRRRRHLGRLVAVGLPAAGALVAPGCYGTGGVATELPHYVSRYLAEADGVAVIRQVIQEETSAPADPCEAPTLHERLLADQAFDRSSGPTSTGYHVLVDLFAPPTSVSPSGTCPGEERPAVGFEFLTAAEGDFEDRPGGVSTGVTAAENATLDALRASGEAAIVRLSSEDYVFDEYVDEYGQPSDAGPEPDRPTKPEAEEQLRAAVRAAIADLRSDGLL
jgi:hypothetical protein